MPELKLPEVLDQRGAQIVATQLLDRLGEDVNLDARNLTRLGGAGLEMLIAAHRQWQEDCIRFEISNLSSSILRVFEILDVDPQTLRVEVPK
ncbi:STAS domain-containing protein [Roseinatronobacter sp. NSM]|uniref:STAS domain-containing protein n=1 Tax=Roseinatronobacter sp. NSM TaxID=3457785 RepID=UPI004035B2CD